MQKITSGSGPGVDLANSVTYNAAGQLLSSMRATSVSVGASTDLPTAASLGLETFQYNGRNQLTEQTGLGTDINYWYSATANDGRLAQKHNWVTGEEENYTYDSLGRLATAYTTGTQWGLSFVYDGFGNRLQQNVTKGTAPSTVQTVDAATNRLNGTGFGYDANGNMTGWSTPSGSVTASYDIENRVTQIVTPSVTETYNYGPGNLRVRKYQGGTWTYTVYGQGGEVLGTFTGCSVSGVSFLCDAKLRVYFSGRLVLNGWTGVKPDRLGSPDGTHGRVYPYGEVSGSVSVDQDETFTTYKRDVYTGLDYAQNRYYASAWGRFTTADPYRASGGPANPGSWNRYAYVDNDPVIFVDPSGLNAAMPSVNTPPMNVVDFWSPMDTVMGYYSADNWGDGGGGGGGVGGGGPKSFMPSETGGVGGGGSGGGIPSSVSQSSTTRKEKPDSSQEFLDCMAKRANDFSIAGTIETVVNAGVGGGETRLRDNIFVSAIAGNTITTILFGNFSDNAASATASASGIVDTAMGSTLTYGRRTTEIMSINLAGKGGVPKALGMASGSVRGAIATAGKALGLGLSFAEKFAIDALFTAAEAGYCYSQSGSQP